MTRKQKGIAGRFVRVTDAKGHIRPLADIEAEIIRIAMRRYGNQTEAARRLGIGRSTLIRRLRRRR
jgi:transcriptional regulator with PAS, ATPase and Fis domain